MNAAMSGGRVRLGGNDESSRGPLGAAVARLLIDLKAPQFHALDGIQKAGPVLWQKGKK